MASLSPQDLCHQIPERMYYLYTAWASIPLSNKGMIPCEKKLHAECKTDEEEWAGLSNATARRKLQNRLNQRAYSKWGP
jgi:hypothetical protein